MGLNLLSLIKDGKIIKGEGKGRLCMAQSWPGQMRTVYGDHQRFIDTYFRNLMENISLEMDVKEIKMDIIGSREE